MKILNFTKSKKQSSGFTIAELITIIVVIGVLAAVSVVAYGSWRDSIDAAQIKSDLNGAVAAVEDFRNFHGHYPEANNCTNTTAEEICFESSGDNVISIAENYPEDTFCLNYSVNNEIVNHRCKDDAEPSDGPAPVIVPETPGEKIAAGYEHTCAITSANQAYCWGGGSNGQLGSASNGSTVPILVPGYTFKTITAGRYHTCAITTTNQAYCWGYNMYSQIGDGIGSSMYYNYPVAVAGGLTFKSITTGSYHTCAISTDNDAYCWGYNSLGQLGNGSSGYFPHQPNPTLVSIPSGQKVKSITAGDSHTCAIGLVDNQAYCWGDNWAAQLGIGSSDYSAHPTPALVSNGLTYKSIDAGDYHTCAIALNNNQAYCWGNGGNGQIGDNNTERRYTPTAVSDQGSNVISITAGGNHTCAIISGNIAYCWGYNATGQLGYVWNYYQSSLIPIPVYTLNVISPNTINYITTGTSHTCAIGSTNRTYCWGDNNYGQLGDGSYNPSQVPVYVTQYP